MANRDQVSEMRKARAGDVSAQLALAKRYLSGELGLARNESSALHWLVRAADKGCSKAWMLIGSQISFDVAKNSLDAISVALAYKRAYDAGIVDAGLVFSRLVLSVGTLKTNREMKAEALQVLEAISALGIADAQWLLAQVSVNSSDAQENSLPELHTNRPLRSSTFSPSDHNAAYWTAEAASGGVQEARIVLANQALINGDYPTFLNWALPIARVFLHRNSANTQFKNVLPVEHRLSEVETQLLYECGIALCAPPRTNMNEAQGFIELAALQGYELAQLWLGIWFAKLDRPTLHTASNLGQASFKKAIFWLQRAGNKGLPDAWYALSKIYLKAEFGERSISESERYLERAAELGHCAAQLEFGTRAWRRRHREVGADLIAVYWLQKAAFQGNKEAETLLETVAPLPKPSSWALKHLKLLTPESKRANPFLANRIEIAAMFGLTQIEAMWLDVHKADQNYCLVVDVTENSPKAKRRLISITQAEERNKLDQAKSLFQGIECGSEGPEGDYRKRLYQLEKLLQKKLSRTAKENN